MKMCVLLLIMLTNYSLVIANNNCEELKASLQSNQLDSKNLLNLAICYADNDDLGNASATIEKALLLHPYNQNLLDAREYIHSKLDILPIIPRNTIPKEIIQRIASIFLPFIWSTICIIAFCVIAIIIYNNYPTLSFSRITKSTLQITTTIFIVSLALYFYRYYSIYKNDTIIVTAKNQLLYSSPDVTSEILDTFHIGQAIHKSDEVGIWTKVKTEYNTIGWMQNQHYKSISF